MEMFWILTISIEYTVSDIVLEFCKILPLGKLGQVYMVSLYDFLKLYVNLELSQNEKL